MSKKPFNQLSNAQAERLAILSEELGEGILAIGKILRHGYESRNPLIPMSDTNRQDLERELGDILGAVMVMVDANDLDKDHISAQVDVKIESLKRWVHHQND